MFWRINIQQQTIVMPGQIFHAMFVENCPPSNVTFKRCQIGEGRPIEQNWIRTSIQYHWCYDGIQSLCMSFNQCSNHRSCNLRLVSKKKNSSAYLLRPLGTFTEHTRRLHLKPDTRVFVVN